MMVVTINIFIGVISGILATVITNAVCRWNCELKDIEAIRYQITRFMENLDFALSEGKPVSVLEIQKIVYERFFQNVIVIASGLVIFSRKGDHIVNDLCELRKKLYQKGADIDNDWLKDQLILIRDKKY